MGHFRVRTSIYLRFPVINSSFYLLVSNKAIFYSGQEDYSFAELLPMAVIGVIGGLLGEYVLFNVSYLFHILYGTGIVFFLSCDNC